MGYRKPKTASTRKLLAGLAGVSLLLLFLPARWTSGLIGLVQPVVPLQDGSRAAIDAVGEALAEPEGTVSESEYQAALLRAAAYEHQTAALAARIEDLEREVELLTATRLWDAGGSKIGTKGRLIPARVVGEDILPWHSSQLVSAGSLQGVPRGAPVVSNAFTINLGESGGLRGGLAILLGETFIGNVEKVGTHTSRVKLLSDPSVQMKVRVGRLTESGFVLADGYYWMVGRGDGAMEICDVEARYVESKMIEPGDIVLSDSTNEGLPAALTIGRVTSVIINRDNPLFVHLGVAPATKAADLEQVFVFDPRDEPS